MSWDEHREPESPLRDGSAHKTRDATSSSEAPANRRLLTYVRLFALMAAAIMAFDLLYGQYDWELSSIWGRLWDLAFAVPVVFAISWIMGRLDTKTRQRFRQSVGGILWIAACATMVSLVTGRSFVLVFFGMLAVALTGGMIALFWLARWAERDDARAGRFGIATLFLVTAYVAVFLAAVRWMLVAASEHHGTGSAGAPLAVMAGVSAVSLLLLFLSVPILLGLLDSSMRLAVWLIRKPWIQAALARCRRH